jgi:hypothetical protein
VGYWNEFKYHPAIPWTESFIERHADKWDWKELSENTALPWSENLIEFYTNEWDWKN